jgi:hypothetical protein
VVSAVPEEARVSERIPAPELSYVRRMTETAGRWERRGDYAIWCGNRKNSEPPYALYELTPEGVLPVAGDGPGPVMHRIAAGTPHYIEHLLGFWHVADCDAVWLESSMGDGRYFSILLGGVAGTPGRNECMWICRKCRAPLARHAYDTRALGFAGFLPFALERVRAFNADERMRTCGGCGAVHPRAYGFYAEDDNDDERAARAAG